MSKGGQRPMARGKPRRRDAEMEAFWRKMVSQRGESGLTVRAFCKQQGQKQSRFYWWKRQLRRRSREDHGSDRVSRPGGSSESSCPSFLPIRILQNEDSARWASAWRVAAAPLLIGRTRNFRYGEVPSRKSQDAKGSDSTIRCHSEADASPYLRI